MLVVKRFFQDYKQLEGKRVEARTYAGIRAITVIETEPWAAYQQERERLLSKEGG